MGIPVVEQKAFALLPVSFLPATFYADARAGSGTFRARW